MNITVKELIEVLQGCNLNAKVVVKDTFSTSGIEDKMIFATADGELVIIDLDYVGD